MMKQKLMRALKIGAFALFALAMLANLQSNISGSSLFTQAFADPTGPPPDTDTDTDTAGTECTSTQVNDSILDQRTCVIQSTQKWGEQMDCVSEKGKCCESSAQTICK